MTQDPPSGIRELVLSNGTVSYVSDVDYERVAKYSWTENKRPRTSYVHRAATADEVAEGWSQLIRLHRFILDVKDERCVDHIDANGLNNTRENIRTCTVRENNARARKPIGISGYRGVSPTRNGRAYYAIISFRARAIYIGTYKRAETAARAYDLAARIFNGPFTRLNFPIPHADQ